MARSRPGLEKAITEALARHGSNGKRLSLRQAERLTGLSPATVGELAKGNARTPETVLRFARGMGEDAARLLLLAGFVPEEEIKPPPGQEPLRPRFANSGAAGQSATGNGSDAEGEPDEREWLGRFGRALAKMPPGRERDLWKDRLRRDTEILETFLERLAPLNQTTRPALDGLDGLNGLEELNEMTAGDEATRSAATQELAQ